MCSECVTEQQLDRDDEANNLEIYETISTIGDLRRALNKLPLGTDNMPVTLDGLAVEIFYFDGECLTLLSV